MEPASIVGFDSYVVIAASLASQSYRHSGYPSPSFKDAEDSVATPDDLKSSWETAISEWQQKYPDGKKSFEEYENLETLEFGDFFLQRPISAMSLWRLRRAFSELDRLVCRADDALIEQWESMTIFQYFHSQEVQQKWIDSLESLRSEFVEKRFGLGGDGKIEDSAANVDWWMGQISTATDKLEKTWEDLRRTFKESLAGSATANRMLIEVERTIGTRFTWIHAYLDPIDSEAGSPIEGLDHDLDKLLENEELRAEEDRLDLTEDNEALDEEFRFEPPRRRNSIEAVKNYVTIIFHATQRGEATAGAICITLVLIFILYKARLYLDVEGYGLA